MFSFFACFMQTILFFNELDWSEEEQHLYSKKRNLCYALLIFVENRYGRRIWKSTKIVSIYRHLWSNIYEREYIVVYVHCSVKLISMKMWSCILPREFMNFFPSNLLKLLYIKLDGSIHRVLYFLFSERNQANKQTNRMKTHSHTGNMIPPQSTVYSILQIHGLT